MKNRNGTNTTLNIYINIHIFLFILFFLLFSASTFAHSLAHKKWICELIHISIFYERVSGRMYLQKKAEKIK